MENSRSTYKGSSSFSNQFDTNLEQQHFENNATSDIFVYQEIGETIHTALAEDIRPLENNGISDNFFGLYDTVHTSLAEDICNLAKRDNLTLNTVSTLLKILVKHGHKDLPVDARTLLGTPKNATKAIQKMNGGFYMHFGVENGILGSMKKHFLECPEKIFLQINCDGMSLSNSSNSSFWPIMLMLDINEKVEPYMAGVHHGNGKPADANIYLSQFVNEMKTILKHGVVFKGKKCNVLISKIVCDSPARAFITYVKGHAGYFSCPKCIQEGDFEKHVVLTETDAMLRTDHSFESKQHPEHHTGVSILEDLGIGMVSQVALDYMHMVCFGVTKRLISLWMCESRDIRFTDEQKRNMNNYIVEHKKLFPSEFSRLPRRLDDHKHWKATEYRQFLLYSELVILKPVLSNQLFLNFLHFSLGIRILCDPEACLNWNSLAGDLLKLFVINYSDLYGSDRLTFNIHNIIHLADEVKNFGCSLDKFSCFPFENYFRSVKNKIQDSPKPLQQLGNRMWEEKTIKSQSEFIKIKSFPVIHRTKTSKIEKIEFKNFSLSYIAPNNCCLTTENKIVLINSICDVDKILCSEATMTKSLFSKPFDSKLFNIHVYDQKIMREVTISAKEIKQKCVVLPYTTESNYVAIPFLHQ